VLPGPGNKPGQTRPVIKRATTKNTSQAGIPLSARRFFFI
jgi:hypothetical protein